MIQTELGVVVSSQALLFSKSTYIYVGKGGNLDSESVLHHQSREGEGGGILSSHTKYALHYQNSHCNTYNKQMDNNK